MGAAIRTVFDLNAEGGTEALRAAGYTLDRIATVLVALFGLTADAAQALLAALFGS